MNEDMNEAFRRAGWKFSPPDPDANATCRRCDNPKSRHLHVDGVGLVCPVQFLTFTKER